MDIVGGEGRRYAGWDGKGYGRLFGVFEEEACLWEVCIDTVKAKA